MATAVASGPEVRTKQTFNIWREAKTGSGSMASFEWSNDKRCFFLTMAPQGGDGGRKFNFDAKLVANLGIADVGEILLVLKGRKEGCGRKNEAGFWSGLFHENDSGSKVIDFSYSEKYGFSLGVSSKKNGSSDPAQKIRINLNPSEAMILETFLEHKVPEMLTSEYTK